jgi:predicted RNA-binding Zn-ribbon protein involved in translation (DUF1610 family)
MPRGEMMGVPFGDDDYDEDVEGLFDYGDQDDGFDDRSMFANPGGNSALRAATAENPRDVDCPTCGAENVLTREDKARGYQCDSCADRAEGGFGSSLSEY